MMPYQAIKQITDVPLNIHTGTDVLYDPHSKSIFLPYTVAYIGTTKNFYLYHVPILRLLIEAHASYTAYVWMKANLTMTPQQKREARKILFRAWLTYLWPF